MEAAQVENQVRTETRHCEKHGDYEVGIVMLLDKEREMGSCQKCEQEKQERQSKESEHRARGAADAEARRILPKRFMDCGFSDYVANDDGQKRALAICKRYAERWSDRKEKGGCLVMCGKPGTGKTHLAASIVREVVLREHLFRADDVSLDPRHQFALYVTASSMSRSVKATYSKDAQRTEHDVIREFSNKALLVVDEVGAQRKTENELLIIQEIIDNRYQNVLPTILISNLAESDLAEYIGERALDRMYENGGAVVAFDWESHRRA